MQVESMKAYLHDLQVSRSYTIAFGMRSGSTALSNALYSAGMGRPNEYFQYPYIDSHHYKSDRSLSLIEQLKALIGSATRPPFYSAKMTYDHFARVDNTLRRAYADYDGYENLFPSHKWIYLRRLSKIDQAVSWHIAETRKKWHGVEGEADPAILADDYDFFSLLSKMFLLHQNDVSWDLYFERNRITPYMIYHEEIRADPQAAVRGIIDHLGYDASAYDIDFARDSGIIDLSAADQSGYVGVKDRFGDDLLKMGRIDNIDEFGSALTHWNLFFRTRLWDNPLPG